MPNPVLEYPVLQPVKQEGSMERWYARILPHPRPGEPATNTPNSHPSLAPCHYEGKYFTLGESWLRKDCFHCTCLHPVGVGCCDT